MNNTNKILILISTIILINIQIYCCNCCPSCKNNKNIQTTTSTDPKETNQQNQNTETKQTEPELKTDTDTKPDPEEAEKQEKQNLENKLSSLSLFQMLKEKKEDYVEEWQKEIFEKIYNEKVSLNKLDIYTKGADYDTLLKFFNRNEIKNWEEGKNFLTEKLIKKREDDWNTNWSWYKQHDKDYEVDKGNKDYIADILNKMFKGYDYSFSDFPQNVDFFISTSLEDLVKKLEELLIVKKKGCKLTTEQQYISEVNKFFYEQYNSEIFKENPEIPQSWKDLSQEELFKAKETFINEKYPLFIEEIKEKFNKK